MKFYTNVALRGNKFLVREVDGNTVVKKLVPAKPFLFTRTNKGSEYKSHDGFPVERRNFDSIEEARGFIEKFAGTGHQIYGMERWIYPFINEEWAGDIQYDFSRIKILYLDIEVASDEGMPDIDLADKAVTAISLKIGDRVLAFGCGDWKPQEANVAYRKCNDEPELLKNFIDVWDREAPDIITGWNIRNFDLPYLINRINSFFDEKEVKRLSPWGYLRKETINFHNRKTVVMEPAGVSILDYLHLYRKFNLAPRETYALNHIAHVELNTGKLDYSEYESLTKLFRLNFPKFMEYNVLDTKLVAQLENKLRLIELACTMAYDAKVNYEDVLASTRPWDARIHNYLLSRKIAIPTKMPRLDEEEKEDVSIRGGWVKEPVPGLYDFVVSFDIQSEYPHLILTYGISPDNFRGKIDAPLSVDNILVGAGAKFLPGLKEKDLAMTANLCLYSRSNKGFLPALMDKLFIQRQEYQKKKKEAEQEYEKTKDPNLLRLIDKFDIYQSTAKVSLNSGFGALLNPYFRWFNVDNGEAITTTGQLTLRTAGNAVNVYLNKVMKTDNVDYWIAGDTDSIFLNLGPWVQKVFAEKEAPLQNKIDVVDAFCRLKLEPFLAKTFDDLAASMNAVSNRIVIKREVITDKAIWCKAKNYVLRVLDTSGMRHDKPKIKFMGIKGFKPSTPECSRMALGRSMDYVLDDDLTGLREFVQSFEEEFKQKPMEDVSMPRSISGLNKYADIDTLYKERVPIQVRGALVYNHMLRRLDIRGIPPVFDGDKGRYCYLKLPNPTGENVITFINTLPNKFGLEKYVDYDMMFDKTFVSHLTSVLDAIGWEIEESGTLEGLFE